MNNVIAFAGPVASGKGASVKNLRFWSGADLAARTSNQTKWIVRPWVAEGAITEVDGKAKTAGKTTWLTHMVRAVLDGVPFLGEPTTKSPVVYLTEQSEATFRVALERAGLLGRHDLSVLFWHETIGTSWPEIVKAARVECRRIEAKLLIVDTLAQFTGIDGDGENSAGEALRAMEPLQRAAHRQGLGVVVSRHERKSGGDVGDSGRGSSAFAGVMDTICSIRRLDGNGRDTLRVIRSVSRIGEAPGELVIELTDQGYVPRGSVFDVAMREAEAAILSAAPRKKKRAMTRDELLEAAAVKPTTGVRAVKNLLKQGQLLSKGGGKKNDPYRYWRQ